MATPVLSVERVRPRPGGTGVVVVDFQPLAAPTILATALAAADDDRLDLRRIDPVRDLAGADTYLSVPDLAESYAPLLGPVDCVVGYCSASVLAAAVATALAQRGAARPPVLFVNPTRPTVRQAVDDFASFLARLGAGPPGPHAGAGGTTLEELALGGGGQPAHALMTSALRVALADLADADGMDDDEVELLESELLARFDGWLGFLLAAAAVPGENCTGVVGAERTVRAERADGLDDAAVRETIAGIHELVSRKGDRP